MQYVDVHNQAELDQALRDGNYPTCRGEAEYEITGSAQVTAYDSAQVTASGSAQVRAYDSAQVTAYDSAQVTASDSAQVTAYGSAQVTASGSAQVTAYGSAQVRASGSAQVTAYDSAQVTAYGIAQVRAYGSAQVRAYDSAQVTAYDSAQVTASDSAQVTAYGSAQVTASGSAQVTATKFVAVTTSAEFTGEVYGGVWIKIPPIKTANEWCEFYGAEVKDGVAVLFKAVRDDFRSAHEFLYKPGTTPSAPDWDGGKKECGGGLHFCATPIHALGFDGDATKFVACPVRVEDICVHYPASYPNKVKAPLVCAPIYEVDINGQPIKMEVAA